MKELIRAGFQYYSRFKLIIFILTITLVLNSNISKSQVVKEVVLDSIVVEAVSRGFNVEDFIDMVKADTSFLSAFMRLRNSAHDVKGDMSIYGKKNKVEATRFRNAEQVISGKKRWMDFKKETVTGKFYNRKDEPGSYTAEIFDDVFFYTDTMPVTSSSVSTPETSYKNNSGNIDKLKKLVFNPGSEIDGVPIIGKRMAIFDEEMIEYYDYNISVETYNDSLSCYVFTCKAKEGSGDYPVLKSLNTWFDRKTFNIVYRDYQLKYFGLLFDFDVNMKVAMHNEGEVVFPAKIEYSGFWDIPMRKKEKVDFELNFTRIR